MWLKELKITREDRDSTGLGWYVDIIAHERLGYFADRFKGDDMAKTLIKDVSKLLGNRNDINKKDSKKSGK